MRGPIFSFLVENIPIGLFVTLDKLNSCFCVAIGRVPEISIVSTVGWDNFILPICSCELRVVNWVLDIDKDVLW